MNMGLFFYLCTIHFMIKIIHSRYSKLRPKVSIYLLIQFTQQLQKNLLNDHNKNFNSKKFVMGCMSINFSLKCFSKAMFLSKLFKVGYVQVRTWIHYNIDVSL